jgi:hypothetical protein
MLKLTDPPPCIGKPSCLDIFYSEPAIMQDKPKGIAGQLLHAFIQMFAELDHTDANHIGIVTHFTLQKETKEVPSIFAKGRERTFDAQQIARSPELPQ